MNSDAMNSDFLTTTAATETAGRAYAVLDDLMARVGVDGLTAALGNPGLLAAVDQHATAVLRAVRRAGRQLTMESLASYAGSVAAALHRMDRALPQAGEAVLPNVDWAHSEWHLVRLVAVCAIAEESGWL
jgi:hypothetical protein